MYICLYSMNPVGKMYTSYNWESPLSSPHFNEGYFRFKKVPFGKFTHIIIDVR
jgi:hypothetical protein